MSELLADSCRGVYIWEYLGKSYTQMLKDACVPDEKIELLLEDPYQTDWFWENVEEIISDFEYSYQGMPHYLYLTENGDLFLFSDAEMEDLGSPCDI